VVAQGGDRHAVLAAEGGDEMLLVALAGGIAVAGIQRSILDRRET